VARIPAENGNYSLHHRVQTGSETHSTSYPMGTGDSLPGVKRPWSESDHSLPSSAEVKNAWGIPPLLQYALMAWCLVKAQGHPPYLILLYPLPLPLPLGPTKHPIKGGKRPGHEANHSPLCSAEIKNAWSHTSTFPIRLLNVVLS
jgi:hypothetical protein